MDNGKKWFHKTADLCRKTQRMVASGQCGFHKKQSGKVVQIPDKGRFPLDDYHKDLQNPWEKENFLNYSKNSIYF